MRSEKNGLRAQTTTSPLGCEVSNIECFIRARRGKKTTHNSTCLLLCWSLKEPSQVLSLFHHGLVWQEPVTDGISSLAEFWQCW